MSTNTLTVEECQRLDSVVESLDLEEVGFSDFADLLGSVVSDARQSELDLGLAYDAWVDFVE